MRETETGYRLDIAIDKETGEKLQALSEYYGDSPYRNIIKMVVRDKYSKLCLGKKKEDI